MSIPLRSLWVVAVICLGGFIGFLLGVNKAQPAEERLARNLPPEDSSQDKRAPLFPRKDAWALPTPWSTVESPDLRQFIENLRKVGCPEQTIGNIVRARVSPLYQERRNAVRHPLSRYWTAPGEWVALEANVAGITLEEEHYLYEELLIKKPYTAPLPGLSVEKQERVEDVLRSLPRFQSTNLWTDDELRNESARRKERLALLSQTLTPDELLDYRIAYDGSAPNIGLLLRGLYATEEEFRKVFAALDGERFEFMNGSLGPYQEEKLQQALGPERYVEYQQQRRPENVELNEFAASLRLTKEQRDHLCAIRDASDQMDAITYRKAVADLLGEDYAVHLYFARPSLHRASPRQINQQPWTPMTRTDN